MAITTELLWAKPLHSTDAHSGQLTNALALALALAQALALNLELAIAAKLV